MTKPPRLSMALYSQRVATREFGRSGIHICPIGLGCMQLSGVAGRGLAASMFGQRSREHADEIVQAAVDGGQNCHGIS
jgi:aryl-alcohol dehydrogenase-like predicted oxidoreductase